jgi:hypothetical protein
VACPAAADCTAVGWSNAGFTITERWNGAVWNLQGTPTNTAAGSVLNAVSCSAIAACTSVGILGNQALAERYS